MNKKDLIKDIARNVFNFVGAPVVLVTLILVLGGCCNEETDYYYEQNKSIGEMKHCETVDQCRVEAMQIISHRMERIERQIKGSSYSNKVERYMEAYHLLAEQLVKMSNEIGDV